MAPRSAALVSRYGIRAVGVAGMLANAVAIAGYAFLGTSSPIWIVAVLYFVQGAGLGLAVPAATASVMQALPRERAGAGSALSNTARQVAVALSVAVLGSILAQAYRSSLTPTLSRLPAVGAGRGRARPSPPPRRSRSSSARRAGSCSPPPAPSFVDAMRVTTAIAAAIAVVGAIAVSRWMPGRPRPTVEEMEALIALEIEAAERDLAMAAPAGGPENSNSNRWNGRASRVAAAEPSDG